MAKLPGLRMARRSRRDREFAGFADPVLNSAGAAIALRRQCPSDDPKQEINRR